jgi:aromatic-L-amino-acid decarboxylase
MELVGFPVEGSMGLLVSGGSTASLTCLAAARHRAAVAGGWDVRAHGLRGAPAPLVLYLSEEGHSCMRKAAEVLGLGGDAVRTVPVDGDLRMDVGVLRAAVVRDRAGGRRPFCVAASAGTVNAGAIDPLDEVATLCQTEGLWFHVDGAYGAIGVADPALAPRYAGLGRADSLELDPHKWLSVPVEWGCALVRDGRLLRDTWSLVPPYLRTEEGKGFGGLPWYSEYGFQQTRGFRSLKLWMILQHLGRFGVAALVGRHVALAHRLAAAVDAAPDLERVAPAELSVVCFRYAPPGWAEDATKLDSLNKLLVERIQAEGQAFLTGTVLRGRFALRACVLHSRAHLAQDAQLRGRPYPDIPRPGRGRAAASVLGFPSAPESKRTDYVSKPSGHFICQQHWRHSPCRRLSRIPRLLVINDRLQQVKPLGPRLGS